MGSTLKDIYISFSVVSSPVFLEWKSSKKVYFIENKYWFMFPHGLKKHFTKRDKLVPIDHELN